MFNKLITTKFNFYQVERMLVNTYSSPEPYWSTVQNKQLLNHPVKDMCKGEIWKIYILITQLSRRGKKFSEEANIPEQKDSVNFGMSLYILKKKWKWLASSFTLSSSSFTPVKREIMLSFDIITPFGSPVVPLVYMIVHMSLFFFTGRSKSLSFPC